MRIMGALKFVLSRHYTYVNRFCRDSMKRDSILKNIIKGSRKRAVCNIFSNIKIILSISSFAGFKIIPLQSEKINSIQRAAVNEFGLGNFSQKMPQYAIF